VLSSAKSGTTSDVTSGIKSAITLAINNRSKGQCLTIQRINIGTTHFVNAVPPTSIPMTASIGCSIICKKIYILYNKK
jgi:hypothetical protein